MARPAPGPAERRWRLALACLVAGALALRLWGLGWGLPAGSRALTYHPDEGVNLVSGVLQDGRLRPHLDLGFYNYGTLYFYAWQVAAAVNAAYGIVTWPSAGGAPSPESLGALVLLGRLLTAAASAGVVLLCGLLGRRVQGRLAGLAAAALYGVAPLAVVHGRFATVDTFATLLTTAAVWAAVRALQDAGPTRLLAVAGALAGLAAASKYNAALVAVAPLVAAGLLRAPWSVRLGRGVAAVGAAIAAFLVACPGPLLNWPRFTADLLFEMQKSRDGMGLLFAQTGNGWWYHLATNLRLAVGLPLLVACFAGWALSSRGAHRRSAPAAAFGLLTYLLLGAAAVRFWRYVLPLLPLLALGLAALVGWSRRAGRPAWQAGVVAAAVVGCLGHGLWLSLAYTSLMVGPDPRDQAAAAISRAGADATVAFATTPWYWSPPLAPEFGLPTSGASRRRAILASGLGPRLRLPADGAEWDPEVLSPPPAVVAVSDLESQDALRLRVGAAVAFMDRLQARRAQVLEGRASALGLRLPKEPNLPNDLLYIWPRVTLYWSR